MDFNDRVPDAVLVPAIGLVPMQRRLDSARHGFQRLRVRLIERRHAAGEEVPRDASQHGRIAEHFLDKTLGY